MAQLPVLTVLISLLFGPLAAIQSPRRDEVRITPRLEGAGALQQWTLDGTGTWAISDARLVLTKAGTPGGGIRRPAALAIFNGPAFRRATISAALRSTAPVETTNRDLEFIVGYQSPTRFYYVHLAGITNDVHNGIFLVADADRKRIDPGTTPPQLKDQRWHEARAVWDGESGSIDVYVDGSKTPVMHAVDRTLTSGQVGVGSFDDTGEFKNIAIVGSR
jgi:hypothetical protein